MTLVVTPWICPRCHGHDIETWTHYDEHLVGGEAQAYRCLSCDLVWFSPAATVPSL